MWTREGNGLGPPLLDNAMLELDCTVEVMVVEPCLIAYKSTWYNLLATREKRINADIRKLVLIKRKHSLCMFSSDSRWVMSRQHCHTHGNRGTSATYSYFGYNPTTRTASQLDLVPASKHPPRNPWHCLCRTTLHCACRRNGPW